MPFSIIINLQSDRDQVKPFVANTDCITLQIHCVNEVMVDSELKIHKL